MQKVLNKLKREVGKKWVIGVSGGVDSVVLFDLCKRVGMKMVVVHVNHGLRKEAGADAVWVRELCGEVECRVVRRDVATLARRWKMGLEEAGRRVRREIFQKVCEEVGAVGVILAHQRDDQVETVLLNLLRGSGVHGLKGMREWDGKYWRPMLEVGRQEVEEWARQEGLTWREDKTNRDTRYKRNKVRWELVPALRGVDGGFEEMILNLAEGARVRAEGVRKKAWEWLQGREGGFLREDFLVLGMEERGEVLREIWISLQGGVEGFCRERVREVVRLVERNVGKKKIQFGESWVYLEKGWVSFKKYR